MKFHTRTDLPSERLRYGRRVMTAVVVVTMLPAAVMTWNIVRQNIAERNVRSFVSHELQQSGTQILSTRVEHDTLRVVAVGRSISDAELADARSRMGYYGMKGLGLEVIQGTDNATAVAQLSSSMSAADAERRRLQQQVDLLQDSLAAYREADTLSVLVDAEARSLFPQVAGAAVGRVGGGAMAVVTLKEGQPLAPTDRDRVQAWLRTRLRDNSAEVLFR